MNISLFELFKIGIGPSSSHTVGPMVAAYRFLNDLSDRENLQEITALSVDLYGSLALIGVGHGTDKAILLGLSGEQPHLIDPDQADKIVLDIRSTNQIALLDQHSIEFHVEDCLRFNSRERLPFHSNGMKFTAMGSSDRLLRQGTYYSVGGGFVLEDSEVNLDQESSSDQNETLPYPFDSARALLEHGREQGIGIAQMVLANERARRSNEEDIQAGIDELWQVMQGCIERGCRTFGMLPGNLKVERRAGKLCERLQQRKGGSASDPMEAMDWVNIWAMAVNEENAAGGRVVTAPTNGAAGIIPAVVKYYDEFCQDASRTGIHDFFLVATAIGALYKKNASISGAEVGCQGEVGVACSMAAAGLTAALGGTNEQVENAAEIGMEHNLGLTCDPIGGLVQIPCIERNAMGAIKAIDASRMALLGDGVHKVSLDKVITTMRQTGADMKTKYKETAKGGLAVNVVEC